MTESGYARFDTAIGRCGIAWNERGIVATTLPEADERRARARLLRRCPGAREGAPPPDVQRAIDGIVALLAGEAVDLSGVVLDMGGVPAFNARIYAVLRTVPPGETLTYGEVAARLRTGEDARDVGQAMGQNPFPPSVPGHRVVAAGAKSGGFSADGGGATNPRLPPVAGRPGRGQPRPCRRPP